MEKKKKVDAENVTLIVYIILMVGGAVFLLIVDAVNNIEWAAGLVLPLLAFGLILFWDYLLDKDSRLRVPMYILSFAIVLALAGLLVLRVRTDAGVFPEAYNGLTEFQMYLRGVAQVFAYAFVTILAGILLMELFGNMHSGYKGHIK